MIYKNIAQIEHKQEIYERVSIDYQSSVQMISCHTFHIKLNFISIYKLPYPLEKHEK